MTESSPWLISHSGFMDQVHSEDRDIFHKVCPDRNFRPGDCIFRMGDPATDLHLIAKGKVKLVRPTASGQERILAICGPDDFIGEAFLRDADVYRAEAVAISDVMTCPISRKQFKVMANKAPGFALTFAEMLASNLFHCRDQMSASFDPVKIRVAKILIEQTERFGRPTGEDGWHVLETELKHEDIASLASATRVAITTAFTELREDGALRGSRGSYHLNVPFLLTLADSS